MASTCMKIEGGYHEAEDDNFQMTTKEAKHGMNYPCPLSTCVLTFSNKDDMMEHMDRQDHSTGEFCNSSSKVDDRVRMSWVQGLSGKLEVRKAGMQNIKFIICLISKFETGMRTKLSGEVLEKFDGDSVFVPAKGWALFDRALPARLDQDARAYLVELFEAGKSNRNHRVSPEEAELKLRNRFPTREESWLTVKQVFYRNSYDEYKNLLCTRLKVCSAAWRPLRDLKPLKKSLQLLMTMLRLR